MAKWIDFSLDEKRAMIQRVSTSLNIDEAAVEKDWWVTAVLCALFRTSVAGYLLFKGGTSLSKGWGIIERFSENIDLAIDRGFFLKEKKLACAACRSNTQIHNLREKAQDYVFSELKEELKAQLSAHGIDAIVRAENEVVAADNEMPSVSHDKDPSVLFIQYPSLYNSPATYATPTVKVEISALSMSEPYEMRNISSLIGQHLSDEDADSDIACTIRTASPTRTFLEKAFLLCEEYQKTKPRTRRMTRHFYDLEKLMNTPFAKDALANPELYRKIVEHRKKFYHVGYVDYDKELPPSITIVPSDELIPGYQADYNEMRASFIYGNTLDFPELIQRMRTLQTKFRSMSRI